jgi:hypothetical protein
MDRHRAIDRSLHHDWPTHHCSSATSFCSPLAARTNISRFPNSTLKTAVANVDNCVGDCRTDPEDVIGVVDQHYWRAFRNGKSD